ADRFLKLPQRQIEVTARCDVGIEAGAAAIGAAGATIATSATAPAAAANTSAATNAAAAAHSAGSGIAGVVAASGEHDSDREGKRPRMRKGHKSPFLARP